MAVTNQSATSVLLFFTGLSNECLYGPLWLNGIGVNAYLRGGSHDPGAPHLNGNTDLP